ncbi:vWA domain-containing protein [Achromobacter sp. 413638]|uniref:vWA domain-containing protein n=1 Tax=Achromobacter sp. 413638 TaxID=3342385 RepID=UPI00370A19B4
MKNQLANPLQGLIAKAAGLPRHTGEVARSQERIARVNNRPTVVLADVSGSMESPAWGGRTKHAVLREAIAQTLLSDRHELMAFAGHVTPLSSAENLPQPGGSTALDRALLAAIQRAPGRILVISDGEPNDEDAALAAAAQFGGVIDVLYIGPDSNAAAMRFLQRLALAGHGRYHGSDIARAGQPALVNTIQMLLPR